MQLTGHLARCGQAGLFLEVFYNNAYTKAGDGLWAAGVAIRSIGARAALHLVPEQLSE